jgi:hypothetical protein
VKEQHYQPQRISLPNEEVPVQLAAGKKYLVIKTASLNIYHYSLGCTIRIGDYYETIKHDRREFKRIKTDLLQTFLVGTIYAG